MKHIKYKFLKDIQTRSYRTKEAELHDTNTTIESNIP
jgi:hypothetical protein